MNRCHRIVGLALAALLVGCSNQLPSDWRSLRWLEAVADPVTAAEDGLTVQFLGAAGVFLQYGDQALLCDPFFSNPPLSHWLLLRTLQVRTEVIDRNLPPTDHVRGILVGHGHFDHALDVPHVASRFGEEVKVYGSRTVCHLMAAELPSSRLVVLNDHMAQDLTGGDWVYVTPRLRVLPIYSEHAPNVGKTVLADGSIDSPLAKRARSVLSWKAGVNLNFVIDFLDPAHADPRVSFRVFHQSSASGAPRGLPPDWLLADGVPFDLAALCTANYDKVTGYPEAVLGRLAPREVLLIHWEVFWDDYSTEHSRPLPGLDFADLESRIRSVVGEDTPVRVPNRGARFQLTRQPR